MQSINCSPTSFPLFVLVSKPMATFSSAHSAFFQLSSVDITSSFIEIGMGAGKMKIGVLGTKSQTPDSLNGEDFYGLVILEYACTSSEGGGTTSISFPLCFPQFL